MKNKIISISTILIILISGLMISVSGQKTADKDQFKQINEDGFGSIFNKGPRGTAIFNGSFVIGTANYEDDSSLAFDQDWPAKEYLDKILGMSGDYNKELTSDGCEIWSYDGQSWTQLVGDSPEALMPSGFSSEHEHCSEVGDIIEFKGFLYAGLRNHHEGCEIWRTRSINETWECVFNSGGGNINNVWAMKFNIFKDQLYMGTYNMADGTELFRTSDGITWEKVVGIGTKTPAGFGTKAKFYCWSMKTYDEHIYVGAHGGSKGGYIYRSLNGIDWEPLIAGENYFEAKEIGADYPGGFGMHAIGGFRDMEVYNNELYVCSAGGWYMNIIFSKIGKILTINNRWRHMNPLLFFKSVASSIWKYNSTTEKWTKVIGGNQKDISGSGFGDKYNNYFWDMKTDGKDLYVSTMHQDPINVIFTRKGLLSWTVRLESVKGHGEIWKFDGKNWNNVIGKKKGLEFDQEYNVGIREMNFYQDSTLLATMNLKTGVEVWEIKN